MSTPISPSAATRTYVVAPDTSRIDFVTSKVTRSHNSGFKKFDGQVAVENSPRLFVFGLQPDRTMAERTQFLS